MVDRPKNIWFLYDDDCLSVASELSLRYKEQARAEASMGALVAVLNGGHFSVPGHKWYVNDSAYHAIDEYITRRCEDFATVAHILKQVLHMSALSGSVFVSSF